jgi:uncharacterized protein with PIN domain
LNRQKELVLNLRDGDVRVKRRSPTPSFLADHMLGRLARWLRALGYDTEYDPSLDDPQLALKAAREDRVLLTRDSGLVQRRMVRKWVLVDSGRLGAQLKQVILEVGLPPPVIRVRRCMVCNGDIKEVAVDEAAQHVPPFVAKTQSRFYKCTRCGRYYWAGTHVQKMRAKLREVLSDTT